MPAFSNSVVGIAVVVAARIIVAVAAAVALAHQPGPLVGDLKQCRLALNEAVSTLFSIDVK